MAPISSGLAAVLTQLADTLTSDRPDDTVRDDEITDLVRHITTSPVLRLATRVVADETRPGETRAQYAARLVKTAGGNGA